jgi:hypothetical protein
MGLLANLGGLLAAECFGGAPIFAGGYGVFGLDVGKATVEV